MKFRYSLPLGLYMLVMGLTLLICSSIYRWDLYIIEKSRAIKCPNRLHSKPEPVFKPVNYDEREYFRKLPLCQNIKWWNLFAEAGIICGSFYIFCLLSWIAIFCYDVTRGEGQQPLNFNHDNEHDLGQINVKKKRLKWLSNWFMSMVVFLLLSIFLLTLAVIFLGAIQWKQVPDGKGVAESYAPFILFIAAIWHLIFVLGLIIFLASIIFCPSSFSLTRKVLGLKKSNPPQDPVATETEVTVNL